jgi:hypothetical protein
MASPFDFDAEQQKIKRRRAVAEALIAQSMQPMGGTEMVSGVAVKRSPLEGIAHVAKAYFAGKQNKGLDEQETDLNAKYRREIAEANEEYLRGSKDPAIGREAAASRLGSRVMNPAEYSKLLVADALKGGDIKAYKPGDVLFRDGKQVGEIPEKTGNRKTFTDTQGITRFQDTGEQVLATEKPKAPEGMRYGASGELEAIPGFVGMKKEIAAAGATKIPITVGAEKKYGEAFASKIAEADVSMRDTAIKAPELAERANRVKEVLASGKVITGAGADFRLALGKVMGLVGASDAETISNTEAVVTDLAKNTLDAIKASGLGSGSGFSNADRDFLEKAVGGKIGLEAKTIDRLADLAHRAAEKSSQRWGDRAKQIPDSALEGTGITRETFQVPPLYKKSTKGYVDRRPGSVAIPAVGAVQDGYRFKGGDPGKKENWEKEK